MKLFKPYTFSWPQIGVFKLALLSIGVLVGVHWHDFFQDKLALIAIVAIVASLYVIYVALNKAK